MRLLTILMCALLVCSMVGIGYSQANDVRTQANELSKLLFSDEGAIIDASVRGVQVILQSSFERNATTRPHSAVLGQAMVEILEETLRKPETIKQFRDAQVDLLLEIYTAAEIQELLNFYNTPVGKKTIKILPEITNKSLEQGSTVASNIITTEEFQKAVADKIEKLKKEGKLPSDF